MVAPATSVRTLLDSHSLGEEMTGTPHTMSPWVPITNLLDLKHLGEWHAMLNTEPVA